MTVHDLEDGDKLTITSIFRGSPTMRITLYEAESGQHARTYLSADRAESLALELLERAREAQKVARQASEPHLGCACPLEGCKNCHRDCVSETASCGCGAP